MELPGFIAGNIQHVFVALAAIIALRLSIRRGGGYLALYALISALSVFVLDYLLFDSAPADMWHTWLTVRCGALAVLAAILCKKSTSKLWWLIAIAVTADYTSAVTRLAVASFPDTFPDPSQFATMFCIISYAVAIIEVIAAYGRDSGSIYNDIRRINLLSLHRSLHHSNSNRNEM